MKGTIIMERIRDAIVNLGTVFSNWRYAISAFVIAAGFYLLNAFLSNAKLLVTSIGEYGWGWFGFFFAFVRGYSSTITVASVITLLTISVLFGILFSLILYKTLLFRSNDSGKTGVLATIGVFLGVLAPGCAACGIGLFSLFGLSAAALSFLPFDGLELSILAIFILIASIIKFSSDIYACRLTSTGKR